MTFPERENLIEIHWGQPLSFVVSPDGETKTFTTLETAAHWLERRWPIDDVHRRHAARMLDAAAHCMTPVGSARKAFSAAARSAGFRPVNQH
jgi:hypothetical protein